MWSMPFTLAGSSASTDVVPASALVAPAVPVMVPSESDSEYDEGFITGDELRTGCTTIA